MVSDIIRSNLSKTVCFLEPYLPLVTSHMVNFITDSLFDKLLPQAWIDDVKNLGTECVLDMLFHHCRKDNIDSTTSIGQFLNEINNLHNMNRSVHYYNLEEFKDLLFKEGSKKQNVVPFSEFMSSKKCHEVSFMSAVVAQASNLVGTDLIIDIGDGKGYLSSFLALEYRLKVLGIDSSTVKTKGAANRSHKLSKIWKGTRKKLPANDNDKTKNVNNTGEVNYRQITDFVTPSTDIKKMVEREFSKDMDKPAGLVGLHTCGNLAPTCLKLFEKNKELGFLINVGCCYHLLSEDEFPMSQFVKQASFVLERNARMVSLKPKWKTGAEQSFPNDSLLYRAVLQKILIDKKGAEFLEEVQVGRIASKCSSFSEYVRTAMTKLQMNFDITDDEIASYLEKFSESKHQLWIYFMILTSLSSLIEDVILLDRLLYLKEQGFEKSYLVEMFDPVISPRYCGVVAFRQ